MSRNKSSLLGELWNDENRTEACKTGPDMDIVVCTLTLIPLR